MSLRKHISDSIAKGESEAEERGAFFATWWEYFSFMSDPFDPNPLDPIQKNDEDLFVGREDILSQLARLVGNAKHAQNSHKVAVVGCTGVGKRSIARMLLSVAGNMEILAYLYDTENHAVLSPQGEWMEWDDLALPEDDELRFIMFENMSKYETAKAYFDYYDDKRKLVIGFFCPEEFTGDIDSDRTIWLKPLESQSISELLARRMNHYSEGKIALSDVVMSEIVKHSRGVPLLALDLTRRSFKACFQRRGNKPNLDDIQKAVAVGGYDVPDELDFTRKEMKALKLILRTAEITPMDLSKALSISRVMGWKYLERFAGEQLLRKESVGRAVRYTLKLPARVQIQLQLY